MYRATGLAPAPAAVKTALIAIDAAEEQVHEAVAVDVRRIRDVLAVREDRLAGLVENVTHCAR